MYDHRHAMFVTMSDSEAHDTEPVTKRRCTTPTMSARLFKTTTHAFKTANELDDHLKKTKNKCEASNGWWKKLTQADGRYGKDAV